MSEGSVLKISVIGNITFLLKNYKNILLWKFLNVCKNGQKMPSISIDFFQHMPLPSASLQQIPGTIAFHL